MEGQCVIYVVNISVPCSKMVGYSVKIYLVPHDYHKIESLRIGKSASTLVLYWVFWQNSLSATSVTRVYTGFIFKFFLNNALLYKVLFSVALCFGVLFVLIWTSPYMYPDITYACYSTFMIIEKMIGTLE